MDVSKADVEVLRDVSCELALAKMESQISGLAHYLVCGRIESSA